MEIYTIGILQRRSYPSELFCYGVYIGLHYNISLRFLQSHQNKAGCIYDDIIPSLFIHTALRWGSCSISEGETDG